MSMNSSAGNDTAELMSHREYINLSNHYDLQTDADGRVFYSSRFVTPPATGNRAWRWKLLRSGDELFNFCIEPLSDRPVTLSSVALWGLNYSSDSWVSLTEMQNVGQPRYQSADFSVANSLPSWDEAFRRFRSCGIHLMIDITWTDAKVNALPLTLTTADRSLLEGLYNKVMDGGDSVYELVSSDDQSFFAQIFVLKAKSAYFKRFFATDGWKEQMEGRMVLPWPSAIVKQLIRYVYLNDVDGDVCELLPDILDAAQVWELIGMKAVIEAQIKQRLHKVAQDADTDTAAEYLKMAHLHGLASLVPICNGVLADNYDKFYESDICMQMEQNQTYRRLVKDIFHHKHK